MIYCALSLGIMMSDMKPFIAKATNSGSSRFGATNHLRA